MFVRLDDIDASPEDRAKALERYEWVLMHIFGSEQEVLKYYDKYLDVYYSADRNTDQGKKVIEKWELADQVAHLEAEAVLPLGMPDDAYFWIMDELLEDLV